MNYSYNGQTVFQDTGKKLSLTNAYEYCRQVARHHAKTFYLATLFLPKKLQNPIFAMYALLRTVDDLVDLAEDKLTNGQLTREEINRSIEAWKKHLGECYDGQKSNDPILMAWQDTIARYAIPIELPLDLIDGVAMDIEFTAFETFDELYVYCYKVASVVGLMTAEIFGYTDRKALQHAIDLGIAMQLTNILRDIGEDVDRGRIYLPLEDLRRFGYSREEFMSKTMNRNFVDLMKFEIERARSYYASADKGIPMLKRDSRFAVSISRRNYSDILKAIEQNEYDVFNRRAYRTRYQKLSTLPSIWLKTALSN
ncbi:MAG: phytoene/squalene synthase family protein [Chlorobiaceae bacterium]|nr:phytoene/squalene synthase family protein [Chlorobiaceae bacterium]NTW75193.1 phytoene/squalene synthase family protein [Chlorobiaceae bacterium]